MSKVNDRNRDIISNQLHPWVYRTIVGLALVLVFSVWGFAGHGYSGLALAVVTAFILVAVTIPVLLWLIWRRNPAGGKEPADPLSFSGWQASEFEICDGRLKGREAAVQVLLPIAAVAIGMALFAVVLHFDIGS